MDLANTPPKRKRRPGKSATASRAVLPGSPSQSSPQRHDDPLSEESRRAKIAKLKQAIADGTYHIDSDEVARKVIEHMLDPKD